MTTEVSSESRHSAPDTERGLLIALAAMVVLGVAGLLFMVG